MADLGMLWLRNKVVKQTSCLTGARFPQLNVLNNVLAVFILTWLLKGIGVSMS